MQWGYEATFTAKTIVFPCPYAEIIPSVIGASSGSSAKLAINANSLTSFNASNQAAQTIWWIAIAKQQWGFSQQATATTQIAWPITYIFTPYTANAIGVMPETEITVHVLIQNLTNQNGVFVSGNTESNDFKSLNFYWLTIGKQQWGLTPALQSSTITFPVETSNSLFVELTPQDSVNGVAVLLELNNKGFNFAINAFNATGYPSVAWLLFGIAQQWGYASNSDITFPMAFSNKNYALVITNQANLEDAVHHWDSYYQSKTISKCTFITEFPKYYICAGI